MRPNWYQPHRNKNWSQRGSSKPGLRHGAGAENRTPLTGLAVRRPTNRPHPRKLLERTEIIEISSPGWRPGAHPMYHARSITLSCNAYSIVKDRAETQFQQLTSQGKQVRQERQIAAKERKKGRPLFRWPPLS